VRGLDYNHTRKIAEINHTIRKLIQIEVGNAKSMGQTVQKHYLL